MADNAQQSFALAIQNSTTGDLHDLVKKSEDLRQGLKGKLLSSVLDIFEQLDSHPRDLDKITELKAIIDSNCKDLTNFCARLDGLGFGTSKATRNKDGDAAMKDGNSEHATEEAENKAALKVLRARDQELSNKLRHANESMMQLRSQIRIMMDV